MRISRLLPYVSAGLALCLAPLIGRADSIDLDVENGGVLITASNYSTLGYGVTSSDEGDYLYTYTLKMGNGETSTGVGSSYFTVVDFDGLVANSASYTPSAAPAGSSSGTGTISTTDVGDLAGYSVLDSPLVLDLEVTLNGASNTSGNAFDIGTLAAVSVYAPTSHPYTSLDYATDGALDPTLGSLQAPTPPGGLPGLPLPAAKWTGATLLALIASSRLKVRGPRHGSMSPAL